uniref:adenine phosphoribosyltransferase n=1 Tax=Echinostoma caproni TaxID=27848 RepID=A0A183AMJ2_9TREM
LNLHGGVFAAYSGRAFLEVGYSHQSGHFNIIFSIIFSFAFRKAQVELQKDALKPGDKVLIVDDLLATGGSLVAAVELIQRTGATPVAAVVVMELTDLHGRKKLEQQSVAVHSLLLF